ncbi:DNA repair protein [Desulfobacter hydrogenophilus]|uniref:DNA repair protein n=2 Tax=Desulfobacter hydrogenophilus TaxID=2291 RepID=A0A328FHY8_9BACT|nr:AAA family ATPase [Desulfobacter hydrogenophilus]QBH15511.1 DNA repair protein [Desulfobacter hydrogenophilus]RAM03470.1 DNA repair protein [Desulfobacter hydrogenophilus]
MTETYTKARFWKCALQVNPYTYLAYRGEEQRLTEDEYNQQLLQVCKEENIKVLGIADHGNVDGIDAIRNVLKPHGILVFPGFEIATTEKVHFVCLFPEKTTTDQLNRYLGALGLTNPSDGVWPSNLGGNDLVLKINELGGFCYAAHCTDDSGILKHKLVHVWKNDLLKAAQIPATLDELKAEENNGYRQILMNKNRDYTRETPIAIINAKDVEKPETLKNPKASCLIKMTKPGFEAFKLAFQDPESRVRLNSDISEKYYSRIESLSITGGYLDGVHINFSEHLNSVIGGRGTGKSTLLECIRYALELDPIGKSACKQHLEIIKENIGKSKGRIELVVRSSKMNGKKYTIARRYGESASVKEEAGNISSFTPRELLPEIEIYGQNEIYEIAQDGQSQKKLLGRFLDAEHDTFEDKIKTALIALNGNRKKLHNALEDKSIVEDELSKLPKLQERVQQFKSLGIEDKLKIIPLLETEKRLKQRIEQEELYNLEQAFAQIKDALPDTVFLSDKAIDNLPHSDALKKIKTTLDQLKVDTERTFDQWKAFFTTSKAIITRLIADVQQGIQCEEETLEKTFKNLPASEGKSGREIGVEYQQLLQAIERIKPKEVAIRSQQALIDELKKQRNSLLVELSGYRASRTAQFESSLKKLNKKLQNKLKLTVKPEANRQPVIDFLQSCNLEGVGEKRLSWINEHDDFSPVKLAELIQKGMGELTGSNWGITPTIANALVRLPASKVLELQELELPDIIEIELNVSHEGAANYRSLKKLSTGQQCTAVLHLLLLQNKDPLIMDQPEDNLDNAFIADRIVSELRNAKINRQFLFATHNANIPVFGDAEWIGIFESVDEQGVMPPEAQGAIDVPAVREKAANILEGGRTAFNQRKLKYGY